MAQQDEKEVQRFDEKAGQYKVRNLKLADFGRKEIELAEIEMPGLMSCREEMHKKQPLKGAKNNRFITYDNSNSSINRNITISWCRSKMVFM